ncbi:MAG: NAD(P)H-dependent oxidoreductase subunit E [Candidatus Eremiobacteraeota bacterium]|nr:NAD(P)H-dependent oxidoreductase subunit E [Candidatus Eremiobacteraeota bacterium]
MDLHFTSAEPTGAERAAIDRVVGPPDAARADATRERRHLLLPVLHAINARVGWISGGALNYACERLQVPPADAYGVATFYAMFSTEPRPPRILHVCDDLACACAGAQELARALESECGPAATPNARGNAMWVRSPCLGLCDRAPAALMMSAGEQPVELALAPLSSAHAVTALSGDDLSGSRPAPCVGGTLRLLRRVGVVDPTSLDDYRAHGGYAALAHALELGQQAVIDEVVASKLLGRGGAAFPTGRKLQAVARAPARPHYLICNADESEPGTFKDRVLMEWDPFAVIESMTIAAFAAGCERGFIYVRGEYPLAAQRLAHAIEVARRNAFLGGDIMGRGVAFDVEIRRGAGAYICGEETALFNSIEGKRGEPRSKPPFPVDVGLFGKPTVVNNVETLVNLPSIVLDGAAAYASIGTADSTGTRLFCVSGAVARPGLYEAPHGTPLGAVLEMAGTIAPQSIQAILLGGAAGTFVASDALAMPLSFEGARAANATLGSGVILVFDRSVDLMTMLLRIARFFREESCGQCVPCRVGTVRQEEALQRIASSRHDGVIDLGLLDDVGRVMRDASICGLGQTAASAIASARKLAGLFSAGATQ